MDIFRELVLLRERKKERVRPVKSQAWVDARGSSGLCCMTDEPCNRSFHEPGGGCGRCAKHYQQLQRETANLPEIEVLEIRRQYVREGSLMLRHECRKYSKKKRGVAG